VLRAAANSRSTNVAASGRPGSHRWWAGGIRTHDAGNTSPVQHLVLDATTRPNATFLGRRLDGPDGPPGADSWGRDSGRGRLGDIAFRESPLGDWTRLRSEPAGDAWYRFRWWPQSGSCRRSWRSSAACRC